MNIFKRSAARFASARHCFGAGGVATLIAALIAIPAQAQTRSYDYNLLANHLKSWTLYKVTEFGFDFLDECNTGNCFGTNPDSPYGVPVFGYLEDEPLIFRKLGSKDALVVIMQTPPEHRYFSMTPYIFTRKYTGPFPPIPDPNPYPVFESLGDSVNNRTIKTQPATKLTGTAPFNQVAVFIQGTDEKTIADIKTRLAGKLFPRSSVNDMIPPVPTDKPKLRYTDTHPANPDTYTMLFRIAYPMAPGAEAYIENPPVRVFHVTVTTASDHSFVPVEPTPRRTPREEPPESADEDLMEALDALERKMLDDHAGTHTIALSPEVEMRGTPGTFPCTTAAWACNGDAPDTVYSKDVPEYTPINRRDRFIIVGVNHVKTGNATYVSHSVNRVSLNKGIVAASDAWFEEHDTACVVMAADCAEIHKKLYAVSFAYDCESDPICIQIPEGDLDNDGDEDGLPFGESLKIAGRNYLEADRNTRPGLALIAKPRVHVLTRNP